MRVEAENEYPDGTDDYGVREPQGWKQLMIALIVDRVGGMKSAYSIRLLKAVCKGRVWMSEWAQTM